MKPIYLDYNATTPVDPAVLAAMFPFLESAFGNPSSTHAYGVQAHKAVERARTQLAHLIGAEADEIVFTGGGSEATNHAIKGVALSPEAHVITCAIEHPATLRPCEYLQRSGRSVTVLPVDGAGRVDPDEVRRAITARTVLISIMHSNNEVGTLQPIREIADLARSHGVLVHTDAAQSIGKVAVDVRELGVDLLTVAGHKLYAPKGIGALYIRRGAKIENLIHGAGHEGGRRAGTENVPYIAGLGVAAEIARNTLPAATDRLRLLRDRLEARLRERLGERVVLNGHRDLRLPNTLNVSVVGCIGAELLAKVPGVAASTGSACHEGQVSLSPVLRSLGVDPQIGRGAVRLSVGRFTTEEEVDRAAELLGMAAKDVKK